MRFISNPGSAARRILSLSAFAAFVACALQIWTACGQKDTHQDPKVKLGQVVYFANCVTCHNGNPAFDGTLGPAIKGSSLELVQARVLRGEYPPGYSPKRPTKIMQKLPLTAENVDNLHAFLNAQ
jgi:mono/diheme cytochrome c family protein